MNRHASQVVTSAAVGGISASVTFVPSPHGGLRILSIIWLGLSQDHMLIHGIVIRALTYVIMWPFCADVLSLRQICLRWPSFAYI
jgi:hypothetical protein